MRVRLDGDEFEMLDSSDLLWAEAAAVERVTHLKIAQIQAQGRVCVCEHQIAAHVVPKPDPVPEDYVEDPTADHICTFCGCDDAASNLSIEVSQALLWVSLKRVRPGVTFSEVGQLPINALEAVEGGVDPSTGGEPQEPTGVDAPSVEPSPQPVA